MSDSNLEVIYRELFVTLGRLGFCRVVVLDGMFMSYDDPPFEVQTLGANI